MDKATLKRESSSSLRVLPRPHDLQNQPQAEVHRLFKPHKWEPKGVKYKPEFAQEIIDFMSQGYTYKSFAGYMRVTMDTLGKWRREHKEFNEAYEIAHNASHYHWDGIGIAGPNRGKDFNHITFTHQMYNRFGWVQAPLVEAGNDESPTQDVLTDAEKEFIQRRAAEGGQLA